jgi:hypothetical protein
MDQNVALVTEDAFSLTAVSANLICVMDILVAAISEACIPKAAVPG